MNRDPAPTLGNETNSIIMDQMARERLADCEEARQCVREACKCLPWFFRDQCLPRHCIGKKSSIDNSPDASRALLKNTNYSDVVAGRLQSNEMELSHQESAAQDPFQDESQPQVFQQQTLHKAKDQQQRVGEVNAGSCMSKLPFVMKLTLMRLDQGQSISRTALPRPWNPFDANRLLTAVSPIFVPSRIWLTSTLHRDSIGRWEVQRIHVQGNR